jgi:hypothetical protein
VEYRLGINILELPRDEVVDNVHFISFFDERVNEIAPDESRAAGNDGLPLVLVVVHVFKYRFAKEAYG